MTRCFFGQAGRGEQTEKQDGQHRRSPATRPAKLILRAEIRRPLLQHSSKHTSNFNESRLNVLFAKGETLGFFFQGEKQQTRTSVGDNFMSSYGEQSI